MATNNPLHNYRSYSYKHILIACNTSDVAEYISKLNGLSLISQPGASGRAPFSDGSDQNGIKFETVVGRGDYCVVINSFTDGEFYMSNVEWQTILSPNYDKTPNKDYVTTVATEGSITIVEPRGFRFLNIIHNVGQTLECGATSINWVLKTVFVGHDDGSHQNEYISNIKPFIFMMRDLNATFDEGGAIYTMPVVGASNGIGKANEYGQVTLNTISFSPKGTLLNGMKQLEAAIQFKYNQDLEKIKQTPQYDPNQRPITYKIQLDPKYQSDDYKLDNISIDTGGTGSLSGGTITFGKNVDNESMIITSLKYCKKLSENAKQPGATEIYKLYTIVTNSISTTTVTYVIKPMVVVEAIADNANSQDATLTHDGNYNVLEFDYMFTGKNIDIMDFQIKMQYGLVFFQSLEVVSAAKDNQSTVGKVQSSLLNGVSINALNVPPQQTIFANQNSSSVKNKSGRSMLSMNDFNVALQKYSSIETVAASITIHGNPLLLNDMNMLPSDFIEDSQTTNTGLISNWASVPSLCKINVSMPSNNSLLGVNLSDPNSQFQTPFWYRGYYNILTIQHIFNDGIFSQQLGMINVPLINQPPPKQEYPDITKEPIQ